MGEDRTKSVLKRVAQALSVSENVFLKGHPRGVLPVTPISEELELLRLFATITDPNVRRTCLQYVQNLAASSSETAAE
ncbi:hypothetical protein ABIC30_006059 [Methylobacterium sp. 1030]